MIKEIKLEELSESAKSNRIMQLKEFQDAAAMDDPELALLTIEELFIELGAESRFFEVDGRFYEHYKDHANGQLGSPHQIIFEWNEESREWHECLSVDTFNQISEMLR